MKRIVWIITIVALTALCSLQVYAKEEKPAQVKWDIKTNELVFQTEDTAATSSIRWRTIGFTVRTEKTYGNPIKDDKYGIFDIKEASKKSQK